MPRLFGFAVLLLVAFAAREVLLSQTCLEGPAEFLSWANAVELTSFLGIAYVLQAGVDLVQRLIRRLKGAGAAPT